MVKNQYNRENVLEIARTYGNLYAADRILALDSVSIDTKNSIARRVLFEKLPKYMQIVPEELQVDLPLDLISLDNVCHKAMEEFNRHIMNRDIRPR